MSVEAPISVCPVIGVKARLLVPPAPRAKKTAPSEGQRSLLKLLERRKERYLARRVAQSVVEANSGVQTRSTCVVLPQLVHNPIMTELRDSLPSIHLAAKTKRRKLAARRVSGDTCAALQPVGSPKQPSVNLLSQLGMTLKYKGDITCCTVRA